MVTEHSRKVPEIRKAQIVDFIDDYWEENGYAPTKAEVAKAISLSDRITRIYINILVDNWVLIEAKGHRTLRVMR